ncbi:integrase/recombinase XerC [Dokdonella fugitiva]|uniref:Tyrosine recombinase XerC n=1 Tax=Dokdonella fugitiva TaxID=328517 RepID=A0A839F144_9GAMM|nr:tyrosine recombinase XerC [Dokdonella fugitiva]MBA8887762.1 integrase/recombinase XerC [Dokdonella fugitiva]
MDPVAASGTDLGAAVDRFLHYLRDERRYSASTVEHYAHAIAQLAEHAEERGLSRWRDLKPDQAQAVLAERHRRRGYSPSTLRGIASAWRSFFRWLAREGEVAINPATGLRSPKVKRKLPEVLDTDEMTALVELPGDDPDSVRDRALLELLYSSGLRVAELCDVRWRDLDAGDGSLRVTGKGNKTRIVPVGAKALAALVALREQDRCGDDDPLVRGRRGAPLTPNGVRARLKKRAQEQGVWKRVYPHLLRHSCASHLLESSGDLRAVQELLGHADIGTTQIYTHLDFQHLAKVYDAAHPRARRKAGA